VRLIREKHPLNGHTLQLLGQTHRRGVLHVTVALPDGGTLLVPAAWTDQAAASPVETKTTSIGRTLGSLLDLMRARTVVDALLNKLDSVAVCPAGEEQEGPCATGTVSIAFTATTDSTTALGPDRPRTPDRRRGDPGKSDREGPATAT
jgi:hypothetical protein